MNGWPARTPSWPSVADPGSFLWARLAVWALGCVNPPAAFIADAHQPLLALNEAWLQSDERAAILNKRWPEEGMRLIVSRQKQQNSKCFLYLNVVRLETKTTSTHPMSCPHDSSSYDHADVDYYQCIAQTVDIEAS